MERTDQSTIVTVKETYKFLDLLNSARLILPCAEICLQLVSAPAERPRQETGVPPEDATPAKPGFEYLKNYANLELKATDKLNPARRERVAWETEVRALDLIDRLAKVVRFKRLKKRA